MGRGSADGRGQHLPTVVSERTHPVVDLSGLNECDDTFHVHLVDGQAPPDTETGLLDLEVSVWCDNGACPDSDVAVLHHYLIPGFGPGGEMDEVAGRIEQDVYRWRRDRCPTCGTLGKMRTRAVSYPSGLPFAQY